MDAAMMETSLSIPIPPAVAKHARQAQCFMGDVGTEVSEAAFHHGRLWQKSSWLWREPGH